MSRILIAMLLVAFAASPAVAEKYSGGGWQGWSYVSDKTGEFTGCAIARENSAGEWLMFVHYRDTEADSGNLDFSLKVSSPALRLTEGRSYYPAKTEVDGKGVGAEEEAISDGTAAMVFLPRGDEPFRALGGGRELTVQMAGATLAFPLKGSGKALKWLRACAKRGLAEVAQGRQRSGDSPSSAEPEKITEEAMRWILNQAGMTGYTMGPAEPAGLAEHSWDWGSTGGMQFYGPKDGENFGMVFANAAEYFPGRCVGTGNLRRRTSNFPNGIAYGRLGYDCRDEKSISRYAILMVDDGDRVIVFMLYGFDTAELEEAEGAIFSVIEGIYK